MRSKKTAREELAAGDRYKVQAAAPMLRGTAVTI